MFSFATVKMQIQLSTYTASLEGEILASCGVATSLHSEVLRCKCGTLNDLCFYKMCNL